MSAGTVAMATGLHPGTPLVPEAAQTHSFDLAKEGEEKVGEDSKCSGYMRVENNIKFCERCGWM